MTQLFKQVPIKAIKVGKDNAVEIQAFITSNFGVTKKAPTLVSYGSSMFLTYPLPLPSIPLNEGDYLVLSEKRIKIMGPLEFHSSTNKLHPTKCDECGEHSYIWEPMKLTFTCNYCNTEYVIEGN